MLVSKIEKFGTSLLDGTDLQPQRLTETVSQKSETLVFMGFFSVRTRLVSISNGPAPLKHRGRLVQHAFGFFSSVSRLALWAPEVIGIIEIALRLLARDLLHHRRCTLSARVAFLHGGANALALGSVLVALVCRKIRLAQCSHGKLVAPFIFPIARVALHPTEFHLVFFAERQQALPEIDVLRALRLAEPPIFLFPLRGPTFHDRVHQILRVAVKDDLAGLLQQFQPRNGGEDFHAVVRSLTKAAAGLLALIGFRMQQDHAVTAGTRI